MRAAFGLSRHLRSRLAPLSSHLHLSRLHTIPSPPSPSPPTSQILNTDLNLTQNLNAGTSPSQTLIRDDPMSEFLSRFVHSLRPKLVEAFPDVARNVLDEMLLLICQTVVQKMDGTGAVAEDQSVELSDDLWKTIWEISNSVHAAMTRDKMRTELKKYVHSDEVKEMCRFAADIGIRGSLLRELRFKWAREKLEEDKFYSNLEQMREEGNKQGTGEVEEKERLKLTALPERKGKIAYKIYGLDLSDPKWAEVAERVEIAGKKFLPEEPKPVEGKCRRIEERLMGLDVTKDDPNPLVMEWKESMEGPKRVDWIAFLERIKEKNSDLYFKVYELLLAEETFGATIRDYSRLIDLHSKSNRVESAERILTKMTDAGLKPDTLTSTILVHMYAQLGKLDLAKQHFLTLKNNGFKPDFNLYNSMIKACVKARDAKFGEQLVGEMESRDIKPGRENYMGLLRAFRELHQVEGVQRIMDKMQFSGVTPDSEAYNVLIQAYGETGNPDNVQKARSHFDQMVRMGDKPDDSCTSSMIKGYMMNNLLDKALDLLLGLEKDGFKLGVLSYSVLVDWFGRLGLVEEAEQVAGRIKEETGSDPLEVQVSLCEMYARVKMEEKVKESIRVLEGKKRELNREQFEKVVKGLLDGGYGEDAKRVCNWMRSLGFEIPEMIMLKMTAQSVFPSSKSKSSGRKGFR